MTITIFWTADNIIFMVKVYLLLVNRIILKVYRYQMNLN